MPKFSALMLNIRDMGGKEKLFMFMERVEAICPHETAKGNSLPKAIQVAECVGNYQVETQKR